MKTPDFSKFIKISIEVIKKNKWLLIFGALAGSGGGLSFNSGSDISKYFTPKGQTEPDLIQSIPEKTANVLGTYTSALQDWFYKIPASKWLLLVLLLSLLAAIGIITVVIIQNWARGALIAGIDHASAGKNVNLASTSPYGFKYVKKLILLSLLLFLIVFSITVIAPIIWVVIFLIIKNVTPLSILWIIIGILALIAIFLMAFILTTITNAFAQRLIILKDLKVNEALQKAFVITRRTLLASILTGVVNFAFRTIVGIALIILLAILIGLPSYLVFTSLQSNPTLSVILGTFTAMAFLMFVVFSSIIGAALNVFSYSNWNQLFNEYFINEGGTENE